MSFHNASGKVEKWEYQGGNYTDNKMWLSVGGVSINPEGGHNRALYESANLVKYNKNTGYYELNGLTDLTEADMAVIYTHSNNDVWFLTNWTHRFYMIKKLRTLIPISVTSINLGYIGILSGASWDLAFHSCEDIEVLYWYGLKVKPSSMTQCFANCYKLKKIDYLNFERLTSQHSVNIMFFNCRSLEEVWLYKVVYNLSFKESPLIRYDCYKYMIDHAANKSAITVTVHKTTYAYLTGTTPPTEQVGGTTEEWQALVTTAAGKQISFVTA